MKYFLFIFNHVFADIVFSCEQAADFCLQNKIYLNLEQICNKETGLCLDTDKHACDGNALFDDEQYTEENCVSGKTQTVSQFLQNKKLLTDKLQ